MLKKWVKETVIGLNLCPFAKPVFESNLIRFSETDLVTEDEASEFFLDELAIIQNALPQEISTTLMSFNKWPINFYDFNDFVGWAESILEEVGLDEHFQLVVFHPQFHFEDLELHDRANLVNKSPMPVIHILRSIEVEMSLKEIKDGENISFINQEKLEALTDEEIKKHFPYLFES
jgi:hypothetical protein